MAKLPPGGPLLPGRGIRFPGSWYSYDRLGEISARATPEPAKFAISPHAIQLRKTFKGAVTAVRYMSAAQQLFSIDISEKTWLGRNDLLLSTIYGRAFRYQRPNGIKVVSVAARQDVSDLLDAIWQRRGGLLVRDTNWWEPLLPGVAGTFLMSNGPNELPSYEPPPVTPGGGLTTTFQLGTSLTANTAAFAFKGMTWTTDFDIEIGGLWMMGDYTMGQVYAPLAAIASNGGGAGTLSQVTLGPGYTLPETFTDRWQYLPFTVPVPFSQGDLVAIGVGRTDGTGTFAFPLNGLTAGTYNWPIPGRPRRYFGVASNAPSTGVAYSDIGPGGAVQMGLAYRAL